MCYWLLGRLAQDDALQAEIRDELDPVLTTYVSSTHSASNFATALKQCPKYLSLYHEVLRTTSSSGSVRHTSQATQLAKRTIPPGMKLVVLYREMFTDPSAFGEDAGTFRWDRFLGKKGEALVRSKSFQPFGGGVAYCPGRFLSQAEILTFGAVIVWEYDLSLRSEGVTKELPRMETKKPSLGIMGSVDAEDIVLNVTRRKDFESPI